MLVEDNLLCRHMSIEVFLEVLVRNFVAILKLPIVITVLLYSIIGQVNETVPQILQVELAARGPYVTIFIKVPLHGSINGGEEAEAPNIELTVAYKQWSLNVPLDDMRVVRLL